MESNILHVGRQPERFWLGGGCSIRFTFVRFAVAAVLCLATTAHAGHGYKSDPAFAGVSLNDLGGACALGDPVEGGPAADADVHIGDMLMSISGAAIAGCQDAVDVLGAHKPGDTVVFQVMRQNADGTQVLLPVTVTLSTRSEVLARRVGQHVAASELVDIDGHAWSIDERDGRPLVIGAFSARCGDCSELVDRVAAELAHRGITADVLAVTADPIGEPLTREHVAWLHHMTPLAIADAQTYSSFATTDGDRAFFTVIDRAGVVRLVVPIAAGADDEAASIDEVLDGAEQAGHAHRRR